MKFPMNNCFKSDVWESGWAIWYWRYIARWDHALCEDLKRIFLQVWHNRHYLWICCSMNMWVKLSGLTVMGMPPSLPHAPTSLELVRAISSTFSALSRLESMFGSKGSPFLCLSGWSERAVPTDCACFQALNLLLARTLGTTYHLLLSCPLLQLLDPWVYLTNVSRMSTWTCQPSSHLHTGRMQ